MERRGPTTLVASKPVHTRRPFFIVALIGLLVFLGVTALAGGIAMVFGLGTSETLLPDEWLKVIPVIDSRLFPGLVLGIGFGLGSLLTAYGVIRRPRWARASGLQRQTGQHWACAASVVLAAAHLVWILFELIFLPELSFFPSPLWRGRPRLLLISFLPSSRDHLQVR